MITTKLDRSIDWFVDSQQTCHSAELDATVTRISDGAARDVRIYTKSEEFNAGTRWDEGNPFWTRFVKLESPRLAFSPRRISDLYVVKACNPTYKFYG